MQRSARWMVECVLALFYVTGCGRATDGEALALTTRALSADDAVSDVVLVSVPEADAGVSTPGAAPAEVAPEPDAGATGAPAEVDAGTACIRQAPILRLSSSTSSMPAGTSQRYELELSNPSDPGCPVDTFFVLGLSIPAGLSVDPRSAITALAPGETRPLTLTVAVSDVVAPGTFSFQYIAFNTASFALQASAEPSLVVTAAEPVVQSGCPATPSQPAAPGGYYVNGNTVCTAGGRPHLFHGVARPSLEWASTGIHLASEDFQLMASWNANVVRIGLNQDFWLAGSPLYDPTYAATLDSAIDWAETAGLDVILDLHWSDAGVLGSCVAPEGSTCQQLMPDQNSVTFWSEVAKRYGTDRRVLFELFNEPHNVDWSVWQAGGTTSQGWQAVGMQTLYDTVRATGSRNLVLIGGLDYAYDLSGVPDHRIQGYNIVYATHPYSDPAAPGRQPNDWKRAWGSLTRTDPIVVTEFGSLFDPTCATDYGAKVIQYADTHFVGWTAWAWFPGGCTFPAVIEDWDGTPSPSGAIVKAALLGYDDPPAALRP